MSWFRQVVGVVAPIVGGIYGGPAGYAAGTAIAGAAQKKQIAPMAYPTGSPTGATPPYMPAMGSLPSIMSGGMRALPGIVGAGAGFAIARGRSIARAAGALCLKHPAWCSQIGGTAAIMGMMQSGQIPVPRRRRGRGLTPSDLRSFRRVASLIRGYCPTVRKIPSRVMHARKTGIVHA